MHAFSGKDQLFAVVATAALLIGVATGSAIGMAVVCTIALAVMVVTGRVRLSSGVILIVLAAAITAFLIGFVLTLL